MYTLLELSSDINGQDFEERDQKSKRLIDQLLKNLPVSNELETISSNQNIAEEARKKQQFYVIREGCVQYKVFGKTLCFLNEGDVIGLSHQVFTGKEEIIGDFAVKVAVYEVENLMQRLRVSIEDTLVYQQYLSTQYEVLMMLTSALMRSEVVMDPELLHFSPGDVIIEQGSTAGDVYTLVEGTAEAFVDGVKVGEILRDDIFGMLAAITGVPRTASVIANSRCVVVSVPKEKFIELIQNKPQAVLKAIEVMSRVIVDLNQQVVEYRAKSQ